MRNNLHESDISLKKKNTKEAGFFKKITREYKFVLQNNAMQSMNYLTPPADLCDDPLEGARPIYENHGLSVLKRNVDTVGITW